MVTTPQGSDSHEFTYIPAPTISDMVPDFGPTTGGTQVTITGTNFTPGSTVTFDGINAIGVSVQSSTEIIAFSPAHPAGTVDVEVTTIGGSDTHDFTYVPAPSISGINPDEGPTTGGTNVTITGSNFNGTTSVTFGGVNATSFNVVNNTTITAVTPPNAPGEVDVEVTTPGGTDTLGFTYIPPAPSLSDIDPDQGPESGGTLVTITGNNLLGTTSVTFGGTPATDFEVINNTTIQAITPPHAPGTVDVEVTTPGGDDTLSFTYLEDDDEFDPPSISGIDPDEGPEIGGTVVTITGTNFTGATSVTFGGTPATEFTVDNDGQITATSPAHAPGQVNVVVTTPGGSDAKQFTYTPLGSTEDPIVGGINPTEGPETGGTVVFITGSGLAGVTEVTFGGVDALTFTINSDSQITAVSPPHAPGTVDLTVVSPGGSDSFDFTYLPVGDGPTVDTVDPDEGPEEGGTIVDIGGSGFVCVEDVLFGDTPAAGFVVNSPTSITAISPPHAEGTVDIIIVTCEGNSPNTPNDDFTYVDEGSGDLLYKLWAPLVARD